MYPQRSAFSGREASAIVCGSNELSSADFKSQTFAVESQDAETNRLPSGKNAKSQTSLACSRKLASSAPVSTSHSLMQPSFAPDTSRLPSGDTARVQTPSPCPSY